MGKLPSDIRDRLLDADKRFLHEQLSREHYGVIVVNGKTARDWVAKAEIVSWSVVQTLAGPPTATIVVGDAVVASLHWMVVQPAEPARCEAAPAGARRSAADSWVRRSLEPVVRSIARSE